jgi:vitamin B12 transporter
MANLHLDRQFGQWSAGASWKVVGHRYDDAENLNRLGGYGLVDLRFGYQIDTSWTVRLTAHNVFDKDYATAKDFPGNDFSMLDRTLMLTLSYQP